MSHAKNFLLSAFFGKCFWAIAPLLWGITTWFLAYGPGAAMLSYPMRMIIGIVAISWYFYKPLQHAYTHQKLMFFEFPISLPNWRIPVGITILLLALARVYLYYFAWDSFPIFNSIIFGVFASSCFEELIARSFFIAYRMSTIEFLLFNTISSIAFTLMHAGYENSTPLLYDLFFSRGHFLFSFLLGIIAYRTQRIEPTIYLHIASNFFRYTLPILMIQQPCDYINLIISVTELLAVSGMYSKLKE